jgi:hypothetical protein
MTAGPDGGDGPVAVGHSPAGSGVGGREIHFRRPGWESVPAFPGLSRKPSVAGPSELPRNVRRVPGFAQGSEVSILDFPYAHAPNFDGLSRRGLESNGPFGHESILILEPPGPRSFDERDAEDERRSEVRG